MPTIDVQVTESEINADSLWDAVADPDCGAHLVFLGKTRRLTHGAGGESKETERLSYEAYRPMAERELQRLAEEACSRFRIERLLIVHRTGEVAVGEASVAVAGSAPHRDKLFAGLAWIMDELKRSVPIWKRESYSDGQTEWVHPGRTDDSAT